MDHELKQTLDKILALTEDNNRILRKMRRSIVWTRIMHVIYWVVVLGISVGAYIYVQPYIESILAVISAGKDGVENLSKFSEFLKTLPQ